MQVFLEIMLLLLAILLIASISVLVYVSIKNFLIWLLKRGAKPSSIDFRESGDNKERRWSLYVLKLEHGKYYVGITTQTPEARMNDHLNRKNSAYWTAMYQPLEIILSEDLGMVTRRRAERYENRMVRAYAKKIGLNNVRGGDLTSAKNYLIRFGWIVDEEEWTYAMMVLCLMLILAYFMIDKYFF